MPGWQDDPVVAPAPSSAPASGGGGWQNDPIVGGKGGAPSAAGTPGYSEADYANSPWSARLRTFQDAATLGVGDLLYAHLSGTPLAQVKAHTAAAESSLPWYERLPIEGAGYATLPATMLSGVGEAAAGGAGALGVGEGLASIAGMGAEGAGAGAISNAASTDNPTLGGIAEGAAGGAVLGAGAGALTRGANWGLTKTMGKAASVDPDAAIARTAKAEQDLYTQGKQTPVDAYKVAQPIGQATVNLSSSEKTGISPGFQKQLDDISEELRNQQMQGNPVSLDDINSWNRQIQGAASSDIDGKVAGQVRDGLNDVMDAHAPGWNTAAQTASQQRIMAENLAEWARKTKAGASLGQAPLTQAETYYQGKPQYQDLADLYTQSQDHGMNAWLPAHIVGAGLSTIGGMIGGWPLAFAGDLSGLALKPAIGRAIKGMASRKTQAGIQDLYPSTTWIQPTGGQTGPQVGNAIKNLMLGGVY